MMKRWSILLYLTLIAAAGGVATKPWAFGARNPKGKSITTNASSQLDLSTLKKQLASSEYEVREAAVKVFLAAGRERPLQKEEIELLLPPFKSDVDWRIKVRITAVLPFAADKTQVLPPLMVALRERDDEASGGGNLQSYSCTALARIGDPKALPAMRAWLTFLNTNPKQFRLLRKDLINKAEQRIKELEDKTKELRPKGKEMNIKKGTKIAVFVVVILLVSVVSFWLGKTRGQN